MLALLRTLPHSFKSIVSKQRVHSSKKTFVTKSMIYFVISKESSGIENVNIKHFEKYLP